MKDIVIARIEEKSRELGELIGERENRIQELRQLHENIEKLTAVIFELKNLLDLADQPEITDAPAI